VKQLELQSLQHVLKDSGLSANESSCNLVTKAFGSASKQMTNSASQTPIRLSGCTPRKERLRKTLHSVRVVNCRLKHAKQTWKTKYAVRGLTEENC
jgi:hypothetical protein